MCFAGLVVLSVVFAGCRGSEQLRFPAEFKFGAASAAYQVEGAWNVSDKGENIWDRFVHTQPHLIAGRGNGDVACDSYHLWRRDIQMCEELGLDIYRISISWSRLLPTGYPNVISEDGKNYYNNLIDGLLEKGIEPVVTIHHFDLPQSLQDLGGWANPLIADWYVDYAEVVFSLFGDRVTYWVTINEPFILCEATYTEFLVPYYDDPDVGRYLCNKNVLIAHAKAYRLYDERFRSKFNGKLSLSTLFFWFEPAAPEEQEMTDLMFEYWEGRYAHPVYSKEGGWPVKLEKFLDDKARKEGYSQPRLPPFTPEEIDLVRGTYDYFALNHYTTRLVRRLRPEEREVMWPLIGSTELGAIMVHHPSWVTVNDWFALYPEGLRKQLNWLNTTYDLKEIFITENGIPLGPELDDKLRVEYYRSYLEQILLAVHDGVPVTGYTAWTLMDNFEWRSGYTVQFGLYSVNFTDPLRTRTPRTSARYYANVTRTRMLYPQNDVKYRDVLK
ncbi:unnamed protein product [Chrysodeixis includens]|uniref:Glycosyl hydrolase n=1 Tax=Chrysodeixis includens TaxID=689277 RepID=A0A9N8Q1L0_CHRIL|nr:unnamed protein product [Chrysodeixis includens]